MPFRSLIAASLSSLFPLSFQVFHSPIDGGDKFIVPLAFGPSLFRSQDVGELGQQVAFFLLNEHGLILRLSLSSFDEGQRPSHGPRCDHQYDRGCEHQTQQTE